MISLRFSLVSIILCLAIILVRVLYLAFIKRRDTSVKKIRSRPAKTMIILGSGGHTAEMLRIVKCLNFSNYTPRVYIHARTDKITTEKVKNLESNNSDYTILEISRSREVHQSYVTSIWTTVVATLKSIPILWTEKPELILCNGPGTCVPLCIIAFLFKVFCMSEVVVIFIESFCRVKTFSLTGKILYYLVMCYKIPSITNLIEWNLLKEDVKGLPTEIRLHLTCVIRTLQELVEKPLKETVKWVENSLLRIEACLDRSWEVLNSGYWKDVPIEYRYCYSFCCILKVALLEIQYEGNEKKSTNMKASVLQKIIQQVDKGILLGAPLQNSPQLLTSIAAMMNNCYTNYLKAPTLKEIITDDKEISDTLLPGFSQISYYNEPSMESFYKDIFIPQIPAILTDCMKHWNALSLWKNTDYLSKIAGGRTVPIEIGSRYTEEDWSQHLITFSEFLQEHICKSSKEIGYLAQHQLFDQIPELRQDIAIPDYCHFSNEEEAEQPDINAWFGPAGTISPLHFDPKNNFLCQVFGYKRIILYHPEYTSNLYPYDTRLLNNTAQVDPINPDYNKWPDYKNAKGVMCYLKPGEMLYIPPKWWHHVTALTPSFSVSFWWN